MIYDLHRGEGAAGSSAWLSDDRKYRYRLGRRWDPTLRDVEMDVWVMLNPSTADGRVDDPTIRRCIAFSKAWGAGGLHVVNLFAYRATNPKDLGWVEDPVGPENDEQITAAVARATDTGGRVIVAWGAHPDAAARAEHVASFLDAVPLVCVGVTKAGAPRHPLYVPKTTEPTPWRAP